MWECETSPGVAEDMTTAAAKVGQTVTMAIPDMWFIKKMEGNQKKLKLMDRDTKK
jgi:hypothetical protein